MIRIIAGAHRGRRIQVPTQFKLRPTADRAKEGLFNLLNSRISFYDIKVLDLFSGTGNIGLEFGSRGAREITAVDMNLHHVAFIENIGSNLGISINVKCRKVIEFLETNTTQFDIVFADPPYSYTLGKYDFLIETVLNRTQSLNESGFFILEHENTLSTKNHINLLERRCYGRTCFSLFKKKAGR